jgi:hypothetical protein
VEKKPAARCHSIPGDIPALHIFLLLLLLLLLLLVLVLVLLLLLLFSQLRPLLSRDIQRVSSRVDAD